MFRFRKRNDQEILRNYNRMKNTSFDFERIAQFFVHADNLDAYQVLPYRTLQDLDFEELFMYLDRTCSKIGQQYLYLTLRTIPRNKDRTSHFEKIIKFLRENPEAKESAVLDMSRLNEPGAYFLQRLIFDTPMAKPKWFWIIPALSGISVAALVLSFVSTVFAPVFMLLLTVNFIFHYWNKNNVLTYSNSIPQLLILDAVAHKMIRSGVFLDNTERIREANEAVHKISRLSVFFKMEPTLTSELGVLADFFLELIKAAFLLEPMVMFKMISELESRKNEIKTVFNAVAQVDVALSISSFRDALPYYAFPDITDTKKSFYASEMYHPLLPNPVANTMDLSDCKSVLISGSNMSGKTTFIRTIGINTILSQTINTACAKQFVTPRLKVHSAIKISDSLLDDTSYYYAEVKALKEMIAESESEYQNLFLLDEIFKGTNTVERISSGKAVLSYLNRGENLVIVSTHDIELIDLLSKTYNYFHFAESVENDLLTFDYRLKQGRSMNTNAIRILEINKFPEEITEEAKSLARQIRASKTIAGNDHGGII